LAAQPHRDYLDPGSYDSAPLQVRFPYLIGRYGKEAVILLVIALGGGMDYLFSASWEDALSTVLILAFLYFNATGPREVGNSVKKYAARGEPLPQSFGDLRDWFSTAFGPAGIAAGVGLAIVIFGWSSPTQFLFHDLPLTQILAFITNVCIMFAVSAWSWSYAVKRISRGEFGALEGGLVVLIPLGLLSFATATISITSGLQHWQDSICTYLPGTAISFYTTIKSLPTGFVAPADFRKTLARLEVRQSELSKTLQWLTLKSSGKDDPKHEERLQEAKSELAAIRDFLDRGRKVVLAYDSLVSKIIRFIELYESRLQERVRISSEGSGDRELRPDLLSKLDEAMAKMAPSPKSEPKPYTRTRQFSFFKNYTTVFDFPLILQSFHFYQPLVSTPEALGQADELDRSTYEEYAPASFEYFLRNYEVSEAVWLWSKVQNKASATHCAQFLRDCRNATESFLGVTSARIDRFQEIDKKDPASDYHDLMFSVQGGGPGLSKGKEIAESKLGINNSALKLIEPFLVELGLGS